MTIRLGILGSTRGTDMLAIAAAIREQRLPATIEIVISNKADAVILQRACELDLNAQFIATENLSRTEYDKKVSAVLHEYQVDLIILIGYMRILSNYFIAEWRNKIINVHPSLLPAFSGDMDENVHQAVLEAGIKETGCTVHYVTEDVDAGPIIMQKKCAVLAHDNINSLKERVQKLEGEALVAAINAIWSKSI